MSKLEKIYRCQICGNLIEVLHEGNGTLVCCNQPMTELDEKEYEQGTEKHKPVLEITGNIATISIGDVLHPMEETHYIQFIELIVDRERYIKYLKPYDIPVVEFLIPDNYDKISVKAYCNVHGLWVSRY